MAATRQRLCTGGVANAATSRRGPVVQAMIFS